MCLLSIDVFVFLSSNKVVKSVFKCLQALFQGRVKGSSLTLDTTGRLLTVLLTCKPRDSISIDPETQEKDSETLITWLECMSTGVDYLTTLATENKQESAESAQYVAVEHLGHLINSALNVVVASHLPSLRDFVKRILVNIILNQMVHNCLTLLLDS